MGRTTAAPSTHTGVGHGPQTPRRARSARAVAALLVALLAGCASAPPPAEPVVVGDLGAVQRQLQDVIAREMAAAKVAGLSIALVDDQRIVWAQGMGWAEAEARRPATADTLYRVGSVSKLFTDTAAMQLVAEGRLALDAPVQQVLPWFRIGSAAADAPPVTLRGLMTHHAGLPRDMAGGMWLTAAPPPERDFRAMLRGLADGQADAPPGRAFAYSNVGLDLVGAMVEAASGQRFEDRMQSAVLAPLGLRDAVFSAGVPAHPAMARGYLRGEPRTEPALRDVPAGGLTASVSDLARFLMMQFAAGRNAAGEPVLAAAQQAAMLERQYAGNPLDADFAVGLGWMLSTFGVDTVHGGGPVAHHAGATLYFRTQLMMLPAQRLGVAVAANDGAAGMAVNRIAQRALALLLEAKTGLRQSPAQPGFVPAAQPWSAAQRDGVRRDCAGDWVTIIGPLSIEADGGRLAVRTADERRLELREGEAGRFGLAYRVGGLLPVSLGPLSLMGFECPSVEGRRLLVATLDGERLVAGERLAGAPPPLPAAWVATVGRWRPVLGPDEHPTLADGGVVELSQAGGRLWVRWRLHPAFGGQPVHALLVPLSDTAARVVGPLADSGPVVQLDSPAGQPPRVRFSGWTFERVAP